MSSAFLINLDNSRCNVPLYLFAQLIESIRQLLLGRPAIKQNI